MPAVQTAELLHAREQGPAPQSFRDGTDVRDQGRGVNVPARAHPAPGKVQTGPLRLPGAGPCVPADHGPLQLLSSGAGGPRSKADQARRMVEARGGIPFDLAEELSHSDQPTFGVSRPAGGEAGPGASDRERRETAPLTATPGELERSLAACDRVVGITHEERQLGQAPSGGQQQVGSTGRLAERLSGAQVRGGEFDLPRPSAI